MTYTVATLEVSPATFDEIDCKLRAANYDHCFDEKGMIDMTHIGLVRENPGTVPASLGSLPALPEKRRRFICTKCGGKDCTPDTAKDKHPLCARCNYLGFGEDCDYSDEEMRVYALNVLNASRSQSPRVSENAGGGAVAVSNDIYWRYDKPPRGVKLFLLTQGGIAVTGTWSDNGGYLAWQSMFKRDKTKEA